MITGEKRFAIVFDKLNEELGQRWLLDAKETMEADADIRELAEASAALRAPERHTYTVS